MPAEVVNRYQRRGTVEEVHSGRHVRARNRPAARRGKPFRRPLSHRTCTVADWPQLGLVAVRLLQVETEDLLVFTHALCDLRLEPSSKALV